MSAPTGPRITQLRVAIGHLERAKQEMHQFAPDMDRAYEFTETAFDLIGLMRIQDSFAVKEGNHG